jgi:nucleoside permease NupC
VPRSEILRVSELLATKLIENEFAAYLDLEALMASSDPLSKRGFTIASYALCGFANLGSLGIQIGVLSALAPSRTRLIARIGASAMISGFISTLQAAGIACVSFSIILSIASTCADVLRGLTLFLFVWFFLHLLLSVAVCSCDGQVTLL